MRHEQSDDLIQLGLEHPDATTSHHDTVHQSKPDAELLAPLRAWLARHAAPG